MKCRHFATLRSFFMTLLSIMCISGITFFTACNGQTVVAEPARPATRAKKANNAPTKKTPVAAKPKRVAVAQADPAKPKAAKPKQPAPKKAVDPLLARGRALFAQQCAICHGDTGDGQGKFAYLMNPRPRDLQKGDFKLSSTENQIPSDEDLLRTISRGMPGSAMPPWGHLPQSDLDALVKAVRHINVSAVRKDLQQRVKAGQLKQNEVAAELASRTKPSKPLQIPAEPDFDNLRWFNGRRVYLQACAECHGKDGHPVAEAVKFDFEGYPVPPRSFVNGIFKGGSDGHQLYARIVKGIKGTPMPGYAGTYTDDEVWDLVHYIQTLAREGAQERAQLKQGTFVAARVMGKLPDGPTDKAWQRARSLYVGMTPLWWDENRIEGLIVRALHNEKDLAIQLSWIDPTNDDRAVRTDEFRDGVAIQFAMSSNPPFYMGAAGKGGGVNIWYWKADRHKNLASGKYQDVDAAFPNRAVDMYPEQKYKTPPGKTGAPWPIQDVKKHDKKFITSWGAGNIVADPNLKTSVETLTARGPGTLSSRPANIQFVQGKAVYERGVWFVQIQRSMKPAEGSKDERAFKTGDYLPLSFAIWNGSAGDRDGKKNISIWQKLVIE